MKGEVSLSAILMIFLAAIFFFVVPVAVTANKKDDVTTVEAQKLVTEYVNHVANTGNFKLEEYSNFHSSLASLGYSFDIEITVYVSDINPMKKQLSTKQTIGNNVYYTMYTTQVLEHMEKGDLVLKEGDLVEITVKNTNVTIADSFKNWLYKVTGSETFSSVMASASKMVAANGN